MEDPNRVAGAAGGGGKYRPPAARAHNGEGDSSSSAAAAAAATAVGGRGWQRPSTGGGISSYYRPPAARGLGSSQDSSSGGGVARSQGDWRKSDTRGGYQWDKGPANLPASGMDSEAISDEHLVIGEMMFSYRIDMDREPTHLMSGSLSFRRIADSKDKNETPCSFLFVDCLETARKIHIYSLEVSHRRIAKVYFIGFSKRFRRYFVCFEPLLPFSTEDGEKDGMDYPTKDSGGKIQLQPKKRWVPIIKETFQALEAMHVAGYGNNCMGETRGFAYGQDGLLKLVHTDPLLCVDARAKKSQRVSYCAFLENIGAKRTHEYPAFKVLIQHSDDVGAVMRHPYVLTSDRERVAVIEPLNEKLHELPRRKLLDMDTLLRQKFPDWKWRSMVKRSLKFSRFLHSLNIIWEDYDDTLVSLVRFLRNLIEHQRDIATGQHIDYSAVSKAIDELFPGFISWAYTYSHIVVL